MTLGQLGSVTLTPFCVKFLNDHAKQYAKYYTKMCTSFGEECKRK